MDSVDVMTAMTILSEVGWDMSKWKTEDHFVSWLRLCPDNRISGDKIIGKGRLPSNNRVTIALKMAASTLRLSGSTVSPPENQAGVSGGHQSHGRQAGPTDISHAALRDAIRRSGSGVLRGPTPQATDQPSQAESQPARIPNHRSFSGLSPGVSGETRRSFGHKASCGNTGNTVHPSS
jgi:Transposase IS116/IS110/IS902 family